MSVSEQRKSLTRDHHSELTCNAQANFEALHKALQLAPNATQSLLLSAWETISASSFRKITVWQYCQTGKRCKCIDAPEKNKLGIST